VASRSHQWRRKWRRRNGGVAASLNALAAAYQRRIGGSQRAAWLWPRQQHNSLAAAGSA